MRSPLIDEAFPGPGRVSIAFGLWMLVGALFTCSLEVWQGTWGPSFLCFPMAVLGGLLLLEAWLPRLPPAEHVPRSETSPWRPPVWLHLLLQLPILLTGFFGGAIMGAVTLTLILSPFGREVWRLEADFLTVVRSLFVFVFSAACFFGGAILGIKHTERLWNRYVPARCRRCHKDSYCLPGSPYAYHCASCGHVCKTIVSSRRGGR